MPSETMNNNNSIIINESSSPLLSLAFDLQVHWLTYLRAYDLGAVQQTCHFYSNTKLIDATVRCFQDLYDDAAAANTTATTIRERIEATPDNNNNNKDDSNGPGLTFHHLRLMEMRAVTRVLQRPEPMQGYFVSKSWCKHALKWLETQQTTASKKKLSKKKQRLQQRRLSDVSPPWPNVNSDLLCVHNQMACSKAKSAKRLDKQAWKILKRLYPDSTQLVGECVQCSFEREMALKQEQTRKETQRNARKEPLQNPVIRRFYTRTRGVPTHMLRQHAEQGHNEVTEDEDNASLSARVSHLSMASPMSSSIRPDIPFCPLQDDTYFLLPRAWCHGWRRQIRTGQAGEVGPPHAGSILCEAHGLPLLPPHVDNYLQGRSNHLLESITTTTASVPSSPQQQQQQQQLQPIMIPGQGPDDAVIQALRAAGLTQAEVNLQITAMLSLQQQQRLPPPPAMAPVVVPALSSVSKNELLDKENHIVVEIVTLAEYTALEQLYAGNNSFGVCFAVENGRALFETRPCEKCDATGRQCSITVRNRAWRNPRKSNPVNASVAATTTTTTSDNRSSRTEATVEY